MNNYATAVPVAPPTTAHRSHPPLLGIGYPLLVAASGIPASALAMWADSHFVREVMSKCHDSNGIPGYGLALAWAGALASLGAVLWLLRGLLTRRTHPVGWLVLTVLLVPLLVQALVLNSAAHDSGHRPTYCAGLAAPATPAVPALPATPVTPVTPAR
ncbi:hypothetical protein OG500_24265 [Kitasatospora sp. NBC_01250]|uniref:hypothetical protein n=1 Tax=unclassified Kitasatospora TaxID=2633591 RepID=UPI002E0ED5B0|nr:MULTISPECIES: hypothetical protein [unclassified Kitasatospora]WSJ69244.1 hypothetical protein OG294_25815 [Kitasatospora sp. NBC_01302]